MKRLGAIGCVMLLAGCMSSSPPPSAPPPPSMTGRNEPVTLSDADRAAIETGVRSALGSPTATFRTMIATKGGDGVVTACGYVNTGSGDTPYIGSFSGGAFTMTRKGGTAEETIATQTACGQKSIHI